MKKIILATGNPHKVEEINAIVEGSGLEFILPKGNFNPVENGETFEENALIKARAALDGKNFVLADDSGLCVDALDGAPGLHSARYAGTQDEKIEKLLKELENIPDEKRTAKFICHIAVLNKKGETIFSDYGECKGKIAHNKKGSKGFGYDPIFIIENTNTSMAEITEEEKNKISHRGLAIKKVLEFLN